MVSILPRQQYAVPATPGSSGRVNAFERASVVLLAHRETIAEHAVNRARAQVVGCRMIPTDDLMYSCLMHIESAARCLNRQSVDDVIDTDATMALVLQRESQGLDVDEQIAGHRAVLAAIHEFFLEICLADGLDPPDIIVGATLLWQLGDGLTRFVIRFHQERDRRRRSHATEQKREFLQALLVDGDSVSAAVRRSGFRSFDPAAEYRAIRAHTGPHSAEQVAKHIEASGSLAATSGAVTWIGTECIGIVPDRPEQIDDATIALGAPGPLDTVSASFEVAGEVLDAARRLGLDGVLTADDLGWRAAVGALPDLGNTLERRYIAPLRAVGRFGDDLVATLSAYLDHDLRLESAAEVLAIHPNTLRYRLHKIAKLLGADLSHLDTVLELKWALHWSARHTSPRCRDFQRGQALIEFHHVDRPTDRK